MEIEIKQNTAEFLEKYSAIPISFTVKNIFKVKVIESGIKGISLTETDVEPWVKNYDKYEKPLEWEKYFNLKNWGIYSAYTGGKHIGGIVIAYDTKEVVKLENRKDVSFIWDIRVSSEFRNLGVGLKLINKAVEFAAKRNCRLLKVETQNINVPACRFYIKAGFTLSGINTQSYKDFPDEVELIWCKQIT